MADTQSLYWQAAVDAYDKQIKEYDERMAARLAEILGALKDDTEKAHLCSDALAVEALRSTGLTKLAEALEEGMAGFWYS